MKDYYKILGVNKGSSGDDIKKAYRKLAHQYHPDRPGGGDEKRFKEINEAYQILSNQEKKAQYDRFGQVFEGGNVGGGRGGFGFDFDPGSMGFDFEVPFGDVSSVGDIFDAFFEGLGVKQKRKTYNRGSDVEVIQEITLEEAFRGVVKKIKLAILRTCRVCQGMGHKPGSGFEKCAVCGGQGEVRETKKSFFGTFSNVRSCQKCNGLGQIPKDICSVCGGNGRMTGEKIIEVDIRSGIRDGQLIQIKGAGEDGNRGAESGDAYIKIIIKPHSVFQRNEDDLWTKKAIRIIDLLLGRKIEIATISGGQLMVEVPVNFDLHHPLRIRGQGMPHFSGYSRGDLLVELDIKFPKKLSVKARKLLEDFDAEW